MQKKNWKRFASPLALAQPRLRKPIAAIKKHRWLVHKTRRDVLQWVLKEGMNPEHSFLRKPSWHLVNKIFDSVRPRGILISRLKANYFCTQPIVESQLAKESLMYSADLIGWYEPKAIAAMDWTRVKAKINVGKARVFDESIVDEAINAVEEYHDQTKKTIDSSGPETIPPELVEKVKTAAARYWRTGMTYRDFERYYFFDKETHSLRKIRNAPARLPERIERVEILYPGLVRPVNLVEIKDWYTERLKEIRRNAGIEK